MRAGLSSQEHQYRQFPFIEHCSSAFNVVLFRLVFLCAEVQRQLKEQVYE